MLLLPISSLKLLFSRFHYENREKVREWEIFADVSVFLRFCETPNLCYDSFCF